MHAPNFGVEPSLILLLIDERPGLAAIGGLVGASGNIGNQGGEIIRGTDAREFSIGRRSEFAPMFSTVLCREDGALTADEPADFLAGCRTGDEIGGDAGFLRLPGFAGVIAALDGSAKSNPPKDAATRSGN